jgi:hypothetical protein
LEPLSFAVASKNAMPVSPPLRTPLSPDRIVHPHVYNGAITENGASVVSADELPSQVEDDSEMPEFPFPQTAEDGEQAQGQHPTGGVKLAEAGAIIPAAATLVTTASALNRHMHDTPSLTQGWLDRVLLRSNRVQTDSSFLRRYINLQRLNLFPLLTPTIDESLPHP